jgi:hypothetical protein
MPSRDLDRIAERPAPVAPIASQATAIEQSRAIAEVQAMVYVAQERPRSVPAAIAAMRESCGQKTLADRAFYRYSRSGQQVSGPSIHLMRELARCWGNITYGVAELNRDDDAGRSEVQAFAWDLEANTRPALIFIVPHARDTKQGRKPIIDLRDVYENNANQGARRLRECISSVLPAWFVEEAKERATKTLEGAIGDKPLAQAIADTAKAWLDQHNVNRAQLEDKLGRKQDDWTPGDLATLRVIWTSLRRGEVTKDEEFPQKRVTAEEVIEQNGAYDPAAEPAPTDPGWPEVARPGSKAAK